MDAAPAPESAPAASAPSAADEAAALRDALLRARAGAENVRKRAFAEAIAAVEAANERLVAALLPVLDDFDRGLAASPDDGFGLVARRLRQTLEAEGLEVFEPAPGGRFDPLREEAVERRETADAAEGTVVEILSKGYLFRGRLLKAARVAVSVSPAPVSRG